MKPWEVSPPPSNSPPPPCTPYNNYEGEAEAGTPVYGGGSSTATAGGVIPVVEEELVVGKREVDRGGVRFTRMWQKCPSVQT